METYSESFCYLFNKGRAVRALDALSFIEDSLSNPKYSSPTLLKNFVGALYGVLYFENRAGKTKNKELIKRVEENVRQIGKIAMETSNPELLAECLNFLAETGKEEAVTTIFQLIQTMPDNLYNELKKIIKRRLLSPEWKLYQNNKALIIRKLGELIQNPQTNIRAKELAKEIQISE